MGGELVHQITGFVEYKIEDIIIGLSEEHNEWTGPDDKYPHYAFFVKAQDFLSMMSWLCQNDVITSEPWTRDGVKGLLYFRGLSGNFFEIYCRKLNEGASCARGAKQGGNLHSGFRGSALRMVRLAADRLQRR